MNISFIAGLLQRLIVLSLVCLILWHVMHFGGAPKGAVNVYAPRLDDVLTIDDRSYPLKSTEKPLVCSLEPGRHHLQLLRAGLLITEEDFTIDPGRQVTLVLHDRTRVPRERTAENRKPGVPAPPGVAIRTLQPQQAHR